MYFNPEMKKQGNPPKRMRLLSLAQGAWSVERPSRKPYLQIPIPTHSTKMFPDGHLKMEFRDTQGRGDGSGMIEESAGRLLILRAGASLSGDIIGLQAHFWGADYAFKGVSLFQPAHRFPDGVHWIIDQDSANTDVYNHRYTEAKVAPWRHKSNSNKRYFAQDPVFLGETAMSDVDAREVAQVNLELAVRLDQENWERALCKDQRPALSPASQTHEIGYRKQRDLVEILQEQDETDMLLTAYEHSGGSIHALPDLMRRVTGGVYGHWKSKHWDYRWDRPGNIPTVMVSGETVTLMSPEYAGAPVPPREHIGFVRHPRREDQIIGVVMHPEDDLNSKSALDGQDYDGDKVSFTLRRGQQGRGLREGHAFSPEHRRGLHPEGAGRGRRLAAEARLPLLPQDRRGTVPRPPRNQAGRAGDAGRAGARALRETDEVGDGPGRRSRKRAGVRPATGR